MDTPEQIHIPFEAKPIQFLSCDEIYESANQSLLEQITEDRRIERKPITLRTEEFAEYFSMWANTLPDGGLILIGYRNDIKMEGCLFAGQQRINEIEKCGTTHCPDARYITKQVQITNQKGEPDIAILIRIRYREDKVVRISSGRAFIRRADSKFELKDQELRELEIDKRQVEFETEPCNLLYPSEFDMELINQYSKKYQENRTLSGHSNEDVLRMNHLGKVKAGKFIPNNACALLFAKDPRQIFPGCKIRFIRINGEVERTGDKLNWEKDQWIDTGSIPRQIFQAEQILTAQLREFSRLEKDGRFYTAEEYPKNAWYEAIVNACVHRSYSQRAMNIFIKMFDDRLIIESPGGFPPTVTPENIYTMHNPRNPVLMEAMFYLDLVKCANEGTKRMRESMTSLSLPLPEFAQKQPNAPVVVVTLRNNVKQRRVWIDKNASGLVGEVVWDSLSENEKRIINFIAEHNEITVSGVQRLTFLTWQASKGLLESLKFKGVIEHVHKPNVERDPQAKWVLRKKI
jgi:ATP-dependent DNA helicase RecG